MKVDSSVDGEIRLSFGSDRELAAFTEKTRQQAGFVALLEHAHKLYERCVILLEVGGVTRASFEAEVAQLFPGDGGQQTAFLVDPSSVLVKPADSVPVATAASDPTAVSVSSAASESSESSTSSEGTAGETTGRSPIHQLKQMNVSQKARLAPRAGRAERQILLRDSSPQVLQSLLANPRLEAKDVLQIVKSTATNGAILQRVAADARWGKNQEILATVTKNPKTPSPVATRLIDRLRTSDLRIMGKMSSGLRDNVRRAALREYLRRSGK